MSDDGETPWIAGIRAFEGEVPADEAMAAWKARIRDWGFELRDDGVIVEWYRNKGEAIGRWGRIEGAERAAGEAALDAVASGCPLVGRRVEVVGFELTLVADEDDRRELLCGLVKEGRDGIVHRASGRGWRAVMQELIALDRWIDKYSFDDGARLLTREDGAYAAWVRDAFTAAAGAGGYEALVGWMATSHNPLRLSRISTKGGGWHWAVVPMTWKAGDRYLRDKEVMRFLGTRSAEIWLYDFAVLEEAPRDDDLWW